MSSVWTKKLKWQHAALFMIVLIGLTYYVSYKEKQRMARHEAYMEFMYKCQREVAREGLILYLDCDSLWIDIHKKSEQRKKDLKKYSGS